MANIKNNKLLIDDTKSEKEKFDLLIIGQNYSPEQALELLGYKLGSPYDNLATAIKILNENWCPNWNDETEFKYSNHFKMNGGFGFMVSNFYYGGTSVPTSLCFKSKELAEYSAELLLPLYEKFYR